MKITVKNRYASAKAEQAVVTDNSDYKVEFELDSEWDSCAAITAIIVRADGKEYEPILLDEERCITLPTIVGSACVYIGLTGGNVKTTTPAKLIVVNSIMAVTSGEIIPEPEESIYNQIIAKIDKIAGDIDSVYKVLNQTVDELKERDANLERKVEMYRDEHNRYYDELSGDIEEIALRAETNAQDINSLNRAVSSLGTKANVNAQNIDLLAGNIASLDNEIVKNQDRISDLNSSKAEKKDVYTKQEVDTKIQNIPVYDDTNIKNDIKNIENDIRNANNEIEAVSEEVTGLKGDFTQFAEKTDSAISDINETIGDEPASEEMSEDVIVALRNMTPLLSNMVSLLLNLPQEDSANALIVEMKKRTDVLALILNNMEV